MSFIKTDEFPLCGNCEHACHYPVGWWYPFTDPQCELTLRIVKPDDVACEHFKSGGLRIMTVRIKFKQEFYKLIKDGVKTETRRLPAKRLDVTIGEECLAVFPDGKEIPIRITDTGYQLLKSISDTDAEREGFSNATELKQALKDIYSDYWIDEHNRFYYYRFEVIK